MQNLYCQSQVQIPVLTSPKKSHNLYHAVVTLNTSFVTIDTDSVMSLIFRNQFIDAFKKIKLQMLKGWYF